MNSPLTGLIHEGQSYFEITPTQTYWLDDEIDREYKLHDQIHGTILLQIEVQGSFHPQVFRRCIDFLIRRHESLRATFHKKADAILMRVEPPDNGRYAPEFIDDFPRDEDHYEELIHFRGHTFDVANGPLFLTRVIRCKPDVHVIAFKIHHGIFDTWSVMVLRRELFPAYIAFAWGRDPGLPEPEFQYKDYLALINRHLRLNHETDRKYWRGKFSKPPVKVWIPGMNPEHIPVTQKVIRSATADLSDDILHDVVILSKTLGVSMFVILQAAFHYYLLKETGQLDILIGTYVLGRDYPGSDAQIGCYAKTVLIRTILEADDTFLTCIRKVEASNHDMRTRTGYPLRYFLEELLPPGFRSGEFYWNLNLQFVDERKKWKSEPDNAVPDDGPNARILTSLFGNSLIQMDMQLSFVHLGNRMQLLVHYDGASFTPEAIRGFISSFSNFTGELVKTVPVSLI